MMQKQLRIINYLVIVGIVYRNITFYKSKLWDSYHTSVDNIVDILFDAVADENYCLHGGPCVPKNYVSMYKSQSYPDAIIIGCKKCGTRALIDMMCLHPQIKALRREGHYFDDFYALGDYWYKSRMPILADHEVAIEKTPSYMLSRLTAERIYNFNPDIKLIVILRNPVDRLISDYLQKQARFPKAVVLSVGETYIKNKTNTVDETKVHVQKGLYAKQLKPWLEIFGTKSILIEDGNAFTKDPLPTLKRAQQFLGLKPHNNHVYFNKSKGFYCWLENSQTKCLAGAKGRKHPKIPSQQMNILKSYYTKPNEDLFRMIGKRFDW
uniref:heparan sulfate glucosamine 3-O-sulfotransferase 1-like n=1 Tax=Ciona intestinalis TaxID=7719 RepID=UPI00052168F9|nr:heparan sulfate glucosamine 3-O-sulfotransferase 1-like [Ciona intestinalis]|eukprot:XP_009862494.1 heparan sulfate glucosamine 3-O-sulfotransferase 1-like [Ciona intestinalis]